MDKLPINEDQLPGKILFWGVGGSHGFGLATETSDYDYKGVYVAPTVDFFRFSKPAETVCLHEPADVEFHEIEKFLRLVSKGNHGCLEMLFFEPQHIGHVKIYNEIQRVVPHIVPRDDYFNCVRGHASKVRKTLEDIHMGDYSKKVTGKEVMHAIRVVDLGCKFLTTRVMNPKVASSDVDFYLSIKHGEVSPTAMLRALDLRLRFLAECHEHSVLRKKANVTKAEEILGKIRRNHEYFKV
jgi:predicted nucleotidyltransferase